MPTDTNEQVVNTEVVEEVLESEGNGVGSVLLVGGSMVAGALLWSKVIKPLAHWAKEKIQNARKKPTDLAATGYTETASEE